MKKTPEHIIIVTAVKAGNDTFSTKASYKQKNIHNSAKTYDILIKSKVFESLRFGFDISAKKCFLVLGMAYEGPIFAKVGPKKY